MRKNVRPLLAFLILGIGALACDLPIPAPVPANPAGGTATPPFSPDQVGTVVAETLTAGVPADGNPTASNPSPSTPGGAALLPHTFYYLGTDSAGLLQVFRIEMD